MMPSEPSCFICCDVKNSIPAFLAYASSSLHTDRVPTSMIFAGFTSSLMSRMKVVWLSFKPAYSLRRSRWASKLTTAVFLAFSP